MPIFSSKNEKDSRRGGRRSEEARARSDARGYFDEEDEEYEADGYGYSVYEYAPQADEEEVEDVENDIRSKHRRRRLIVLFVILAAVIAVIALVLYFTMSPWRSVKRSWTIDMPTSDLNSYEALGSGMVRYSRDGAAFYDRGGENVWTQSYEMASPVCAASDGWLVIVDSGGNDLCIFNASGCTGSAHTNYEITKACISENGYAAVISEYNDAAYIDYYASDGSPAGIEIKTVIDGEGYPLDMSLSPDGTILMVAYAYLDGGTLRSRVVFYNFSDAGEGTTQRIVGGFEQYEGSLAADVELLGPDDAVVFAEDRVSFYSLTNALSPELVNEIEPEGEIRSVAAGNGRAATVRDSETPGEYVVTIYSASGNVVREIETGLDYTRIRFEGSYLVLSDGETCEIYTSSGRLKYEGSVGSLASQIFCADGNWYTARSDSLEHISFRPY